jgi:hypothetical protein
MIRSFKLLNCLVANLQTKIIGEAGIFIDKSMCPFKSKVGNFGTHQVFSLPTTERSKNLLAG